MDDAVILRLELLIKYNSNPCKTTLRHNHSCHRIIEYSVVKFKTTAKNLHNMDKKDIIFKS